MSSKRANNILELIGDTPVVKLNKLVGETDATILAKLESFNPLSCVKERIALSMIEAAEIEGKLKPGATIVEPTSGNTGIGLAMVAAVKGYRLILTMPETMSIERRKLLRAFGAEIVLTPGPEGMPGAVKKAEELVAEHPEYFMPQQFKNRANVDVHKKTTAQEILQQVDSDIDAFVSGVGTGGTITGVAEVFKEQLKLKTKFYAVEPVKSPVLSGGKRGPHKIQGIGAGFIPEIMRMELVDEIIQVQEEDAVATTRDLAKKEGILVGISSGAACYAAIQVAKKLGKGKTVVVILPDTGERYLSTDLFDT